MLGRIPAWRNFVKAMGRCAVLCIENPRNLWTRSLEYHKNFKRPNSFSTRSGRFCCLLMTTRRLFCRVCMFIRKWTDVQLLLSIRPHFHFWPTPRR